MWTYSTCLQHHFPPFLPWLCTYSKTDGQRVWKISAEGGTEIEAISNAAAKVVGHEWCLAGDTVRLVHKGP